MRVCVSSGFPTVSGLSESDYPNSGEMRLARHHHTTRKVPLPSELMYHFQRILFLLCVLSCFYHRTSRMGSSLVYSFKYISDVIMSQAQRTEYEVNKNGKDDGRVSAVIPV